MDNFHPNLKLIHFKIPIYSQALSHGHTLLLFFGIFLHFLALQSTRYVFHLISFSIRTFLQLFITHRLCCIDLQREPEQRSASTMASSPIISLLLRKPSHASTSSRSTRSGSSAPTRPSSLPSTTPASPSSSAPSTRTSTSSHRVNPPPPHG